LKRKSVEESERGKKLETINNKIIQFSSKSADDENIIRTNYGKKYVVGLEK
jgi:hypothetical protein